MIDRRLAGAALGVWLSGAALAQGDELVDRVKRLHATIPVRTGLTAEHVAALEQLLDSLPPSLQPSESEVIGVLLGRVGARGLDAAAAPVLLPRVLAWCQRMQERNTGGRPHHAYLELVVGEAHFSVGDSDAAVAAFHRAASLAEDVNHPTWSPRTVARAHERACRVELSRQHLAAAKAELRAAKQPDPLRRHLFEAQLELRIGLFDSASRSLARAEELLAPLPASAKEDERHLLLLVAIELAMLREDHELMEDLAARLTGGSGHELVLARAQLRLLQARIARGEPVPIEALQRIFDASSPINQPVVALDLVAYALRIGADDVAAATVARVLAGRSLSDPTVGLWTLLTAGYHELRPAALSTIAPERLREWDAALSKTWQELIDEWHAVDPDGEGLAFLQMSMRRDVLSLWLRTQIAAKGDARACVRRFLQADASGSMARRLGHAQVDVEQVLATLVPENGALVVFLPSAVGSHALYVAHDGVHVVPLEPEERLRERVFALRAAMACADDAASVALCRALAEPLARQLLPPALQDLLRDKRQLLIAGYELLHTLPLEWLPIAEPPGWLGLQHAISYLPSVTLAMHLAGRAPQAAQGAVVLAGTRVAAGDHQRWGKEPVRVEAAALRAAFAAVADGGISVRLDATRADLVALPRPRFVAVVAHGVYDGTLACPGGILLAPWPTEGSGAVFARELSGQVAPLVLFLGVCGASRSPLRLGEDGGHRLTSAFLLAGSDAVIATDFDVRLDEVLQLLESFTAALAEGQCVADALLHARRACAAAGAHPRVWGTMRLEGLPTVTVPLPRAAPHTQRMVWAIVAAIAAGAAVLTVASLRARRTN